MPGMTSNPQATAKLVGEVDVLDYTPAADVESGEVVQVAGFAGVVLVGGPAGAPVGVDISRAFRFPNPDLASVVGTTYGWDSTNKKIVAAGGGDFNLGTCVPTCEEPTGSAAGAGAVIALNK